MAASNSVIVDQNGNMVANDPRKMPLGSYQEPYILRGNSRRSNAQLGVGNYILRKVKFIQKKENNGQQY